MVIEMHEVQFKNKEFHVENYAFKK